MADFDVRDRVRSFGHALNGLSAVVRRQHNARIHAVLTLVAILLALWLGISRLEWCALALAIGMVWVAEAFNTALEALADAAVPGRHPKIAEAKDAAAGAVLVAAVAAAVIGAIVFLPRLLARLAVLLAGAA
jgi:diacylglycerol kinase (ATP)